MSGVPESAKRLVRAVLFSEWGVPLDEFAKDYVQLESKPFPYKDYGFSSVRECLESIPDVVRFEFSEEASRWILYAVADENSFMSSFTKKKQLTNIKAGLPNKSGRRRGRSKGSPRGGRTERSTESNGQGGAELVRSHKGLFSIVVKCKELDLDVQEITNLIQSTSPVAEKHSYQGLLFFRYKEKDEAEAVIQKFDGWAINGKKIVVRPAEEKLGQSGRNKNQVNGTNRQNQPGILSTPPLVPSSPLKNLGLLSGETALFTSPTLSPVTTNGYDPPSKSQYDPSSQSPKRNPHVNTLVTPMSVVAPASNETLPPPSETFPPPLLDDEEDDDEDSENGYWGSSSGEDGPPPLVDDSDSEGWSDSDEGTPQPFRPPESHSGGTTNNGFSRKSTELQIQQMQPKQIAPGRGRGLLSFQHR